MIVVADTSPLNYLIRLGLVDGLHRLYDRVLVPQAVLMEMRHPGAPQAVRAWAQSPPAWLEMIEVERLDRTLASGLGNGEREAISLALTLDADILLIDEQLGRKEATARRLRPVGTLAIVLEAALLGEADLSASLASLERLGFRASSSVLAEIRSRFAKRLSRGNK